MIDLPAGLPTDLWLGGRQVPSSSGARFSVRNPGTGDELATVSDANAADGLAALGLADSVRESWAAVAPRERGELLRRAFDLLRDRADEFASLITLEMGKPLAESRGEVTYAAEFLLWFAEEAVRITGRVGRAPSGTGTILVTKNPVGPVLAITPWNFPLAMGTRKIAPALAAGCTVIVKPAEDTPLSMLMLGQVLADAGVPPGVLSILPTSDAAAVTGPLVEDARLRKISFTGSTGVGKLLVRNSAEKLLRTSMELGGNAPFIVFADADLDLSVEGCLLAKMRNGGQACTAANRIYVANSVRPEFVAHLTSRVSSLVVGPGDVPGVDIGPSINERQRRSVGALVDDAVAAGARVLTGGSPVDRPGWFFEPTVLDDVPAQARVLREEVFGPVAPIVGFDDEDEVISLANDTPFGLASYFYTRDLDRAMRVAARLNSGMVGVNRGVISDAAAPFGGVKESGFGREGGSEGIADYLDTKYVAL